MLYSFLLRPGYAHDCGADRFLCHYALHDVILHPQLPAWQTNTLLQLQVSSSTTACTHVCLVHGILGQEHHQIHIT